jgi:hypothetical protein
MSVFLVICDNEQCQYVQCDGQCPQWTRYLERSQLLGYTVGWKVITDKNVMEGRESKRALQAI